jgi:hypothetical protein
MLRWQCHLADEIDIDQPSPHSHNLAPCCHQIRWLPCFPELQLAQEPAHQALQSLAFHPGHPGILASSHPGLLIPQPVATVSFSGKLHSRWRPLRERESPPEKQEAKTVVPCHLGSLVQSLLVHVPLFPPTPPSVRAKSNLAGSHAPMLASHAQDGFALGIEKVWKRGGWMRLISRKLLRALVASSGPPPVQRTALVVAFPVFKSVLLLLTLLLLSFLLSPKPIQLQSIT